MSQGNIMNHSSNDAPWCLVSESSSTWKVSGNRFWTSKSQRSQVLEKSDRYVQNRSGKKKSSFPSHFGHVYELRGSQTRKRPFYFFDFLFRGLGPAGYSANDESWVGKHMHIRFPVRFGELAMLDRKYEKKVRKVVLGTFDQKSKMSSKSPNRRTSFKAFLSLRIATFESRFSVRSHPEWPQSAR